MITIKTDQEIALMKKSGAILNQVMKKLLPLAAAGGISTEALNQTAEGLIKKHGAAASFKTVKGYRWATCLPINDQIVHTPPSSRMLKSGDLLTIDIGVCWQSYHTDCATSLVVGGVKKDALTRFLAVGETALVCGISQAREGRCIGDISRAIYEVVTDAGYHVVKNLTGHGIGRQLHEDPLIPGYPDQPLDQTAKIRSGMTFAIEVIYAVGTSEMTLEKRDKWSLATKDGSLAACFEKTVAVTENTACILT